MTAPARPASIATRAQHRSIGAGFALVVAAGVLWGINGPAATLAVAHSDLSWAAVSALKLLFGGGIMLVLTVFTGELRAIPRTAEAWRHILMTALLAAVYQAAYFKSVALVGVAVATVVTLGAAPVAVALGGAIRHRRMPRPGVLLALSASVLGLVLVSDHPGAASGAGATVGGVALALVAGLAFAGTTVVNRRAVPGLTSSALIATGFTLAGVPLAIWAAFAGFDLPSADAAAWVWIAVLALVPTVIAYLAFFGGLQRGVPSTTAAILSLIEPLTATLLAVVMLHEGLTPLASAGIALLLLAVVLVHPRRAGEGAIVQPDDDPDAED